MIDEETKKKYLETVGRRGFEVLKIITDLRPVVEFYETEQGKAILEYDITEHSLCWNRIYDSLIADGQAKQYDAVLLQVLHKRLKKLATYNTSVKTVKEAK